MAKRFTATELWSEDWFLNMPNEYKLFWFYMLSNCDHAGIFKVNLRSFSSLLEVKVTPKAALQYFNAEKQRITEISESIWFIEDFFVFQYGATFNKSNRLHESIATIYQKHKIKLEKIRGLIEVKEGVKDKDKEKEKEIYINRGIEENFSLQNIYLKKFEELKPHFKELTEQGFKQWKKFVDFIRKHHYEKIFQCDFVKPQDFHKLDFPEAIWDDVVKAILATGVKKEHDLYFRIPQFIQITAKNGQKSHSGSTTKLGTSAARVEALRNWGK